MATRREISDPTDRQPSTFQDPQTSKGLNQLFLKTVYLCQARRIFLIADTRQPFLIVLALHLTLRSHHYRNIELSIFTRPTATN